MGGPAFPNTAKIDVQIHEETVRSRPLNTLNNWEQFVDVHSILKRIHLKSLFITSTIVTNLSTLL